MTQQEYENEIKELKERLAKLETEKVEEPQTKRWKPNEDETYWFISSGGVIANTDWCGEDTTDVWYYITGNCFKTKEEAEEYKNKLKYTTLYKNYIEEHSKPLDWNNDEQYKYFVGFSVDTELCHINFVVTRKDQGVIYASSEQIILDAIKEIGEDNFKKYVLGVK